MWRELAEAMGLTVAEPVTAADVAAAESAVGCTLPDELRALLAETDGLTDDLGGAVVLSARDTAGVNREMRTREGFAELYMPFEPLLFFGAQGDGDLYAFRILAGQADSLYVYVWDHETDSRAVAACGLERYVRGDRRQ
jgi:hypothetical protein